MTDYDMLQHVHMISLSFCSGFMFISLTISANTSLTLVLFLAEASTKGQFQNCAKAKTKDLLNQGLELVVVILQTILRNLIDT